MRGVRLPPPVAASESRMRMCEIRSLDGGPHMCHVPGNNMRTTRIVAGTVLALTSNAFPQKSSSEIPSVWDDKEVARFELPLAQRDRSPRYMTAAEYYALKVRPIYRSYPAYAPGREPIGYRESLKKKNRRFCLTLRSYTRRKTGFGPASWFLKPTLFSVRRLWARHSTTNFCCPSSRTARSRLSSLGIDTTCEKKECWR